MIIITTRILYSGKLSRLQTIEFPSNYLFGDFNGHLFHKDWSTNTCPVYCLASIIVDSL